jgi:hypothetical protein
MGYMSSGQVHGLELHYQHSRYMPCVTADCVSLLLVSMFDGASLCTRSQGMKLCKPQLKSSCYALQLQCVSGSPNNTGYWQELLRLSGLWPLSFKCWG